MIAIISDLIILLVKELRDSTYNWHASKINTGPFEAPSEASKQSTKSISTSVPTSLIYGIWYDPYQDEPPLAKFAYLKVLCHSTVMDQFPTGVKIVIGASLSEYINDIRNNTYLHNPLSIAFSHQDDKAESESRNLLL